jgi:hypothetical protein
MVEPQGSSLSLVVWQGWGALSVMAALTALLSTILAWLLPFPERSLDRQLASYDDRMTLKDRLGAAPPFRTYLITLRRFNEWMMEWFGPAFSGQAFERCLAIAFIFPITLFLITLITNGLSSGKISGSAVLVFLIAFAIMTYVMAAAFDNFLRFVQRTWKTFGGDEELASTISRVVLGAFAVMTAFAIAFAIASTFSGQTSSAGAVMGAMAGGFALAFAFAVAFAFAGAALFAIAVAIIGGAALAFASQFAFLLFLFFILLPFVNASMDWLSWGMTRLFLKQAEGADANPVGLAQTFALVLCTFLSGALLMVMLAALLPNALEGLNYVFLVAELPPFNWQAMVDKAVATPWTDGLFVTGMLMTTLVPASAHLTVAVASVLTRFTPGAGMAADAISDHPAVPLSPQERRPVYLTLVFSRMWYIPGVMVTAGVIAAGSAAVYYSHTPVAQFLSRVALCSTSWSHGNCKWLGTSQTAKSQTGVAAR